MARITGIVELDGSQVKFNQGLATAQTLVSGSPSVLNSVRLPNETDANTELVTTFSGNTPSKRIKFDTQGSTASTTLTITTAQTTSQSLGIPNVSAGDNLVTEDAAQTLSNKTLASPTITGGVTLDPSTFVDPTFRTSTHEFGLRVATGNTAAALLTVDLGNVSRALTLGGNVSTAGDLTTTVDDVALAAASGGSSVTLPASGTVLSLVSNTLTLPNSTDTTIANAVAGTLTLNSSITELIIAGDLTVNGTTTTINTANLAVADQNITINDGGTKASAANAGLTVDSSGDMTPWTDAPRVTYNDSLTSGWSARKGNGSDVELVTVSASQTLTNKTLDDTSNAILKGGNTTGAALRIGTNDDFAVVLEQNNVDRLTLHADQAVDGDMTVAGSGALRIPQGNTAARPSSPQDGMLRYNSETLSFEGYKNSVWGAIGGGSGQGGINYIANPDAEDTTTTGWAVYADAAADIPADGTGGSPNVTFTNTAINPLRSTRSFLFSKDAANRQGQGASYNFTIDPADTGKQLSISFDMRTSVNYAANDVRVFVYDVTNATLIYPAAINLPKFDTAGAAYQFRTTFNTTTSTSYRLIFHVATTNASAYDIRLDQISAGPQQQIVGTAMSEWQTYTPTFSSGFGTVVSISFAYRRVGDTMEIQGRGVTGTVTANPATITIPSPFLASSVVTSAQLCGEITTVFGSAGGTRNTASLYYTPGANTLTLSNVGNTADTRNLLPLNGSTVLGTGVEFSMFARVPIAQWAGSVVSVENTQVEYAATNGTWDADNAATSTVYGPLGATTGGTLAADRVKTVRFLTPIQPTDVLKLEISEDGIKWHEMQGYRHSTAGTITSLVGGNATNYGVALRRVSSVATDVDVYFARWLGPGGTWDSTGRNWISGIYWRVSKSRNPLSVGGLTTTKWQTKTRTTDYTFSTAIDLDGSGSTPDLSFSNLEIGKIYRYTYHLVIRKTTSDIDVRVQLFSGAGATGTNYSRADTTATITGDKLFSVSRSIVFTAVSTTIKMRVDGTGNHVLYAASGLPTCSATLEELPLHSQTSQWT